MTRWKRTSLERCLLDRLVLCLNVKAQSMLLLLSNGDGYLLVSG
jgi:hypothetical protein